MQNKKVSEFWPDLDEWVEEEIFDNPNWDLPGIKRRVWKPKRRK